MKRGKRKGRSFWIRMVSTMLVICMLAGCQGPFGKGAEGSGTAPGGEDSQAVTVNTGMGKVTVKEASKDVTYVAESAEAPQGNLASVTPDGKLWGWDLDGTIWNDPDFPKDIGSTAHIKRIHLIIKHHLNI